MSGTNRTLRGLLIGALCGMVIGGLLLATPVYFEGSSGTGFTGGGGDWVAIPLLVGGVFGLFHGLVAGAVIAAANAGKVSASLIGAAVTLPAALQLYAKSGGDREVQLVAALFLPAGALVGLLTLLGLGLKRKSS